MVSEKVHITNVRSLTRRPTTFLKFADGVGPCGRAGSSRKSSNELSRTFGFSFIKCFRSPGKSHKRANGIILQMYKTSPITTWPYLLNRKDFEDEIGEHRFSIVSSWPRTRWHPGLNGFWVMAIFLGLKVKNENGAIIFPLHVKVN